ncbi:MAG: hypothetical protein VZR09_01585 [Candidatus Gastranaerophilaceae bacterium]|nr:hypothetical protein [Candidatus Gastranaerophilaceae bacterium]
MSKTISEIKEESIKLKVANYFFKNYDCTNLEGNVDFTVTEKNKQQRLSFYKIDTEYYLWAEAKKPKVKDIYKLFIQLILTIGKNDELRRINPPKFLGAFNSEKIAFIPYSKIQKVFSQNDFNWNVTPSNYETKEFKQLYELIAENLLAKNSLIFDFEKDEKELRVFIKENFKKKRNVVQQIEVTKNNFVHVYERWYQDVKDSINIDWNLAKRNNILDKDFFLADLLSKNNKTILDNLYVLFKENHYEFNRQITDYGTIQTDNVYFKDYGHAHSQFWMKYKRPPVKEYHNYIIEKGSPLLVPQDVREIKGAYFTPQAWVQKSQEYLENVLGENWQDEYYIWDCCAGTGNMENGLTNKYKIWASTLDQADVDVIKQRIKNGANLLESHIFQFDFLNDEFEEKCPKDLLDIIQDEEKRKKLIIYINPPIKEPTSSKTIVGNKSKHINKVAESKTKEKYQHLLSQGAKELSTQFFTRIYYEIPNAYIATFCTLKYLLGKNSKEFRNIFNAKLEKSFIVPSYTFDNVGGNFPYGFFIWNTQIKNKFQCANVDIIDKDEKYIGTKTITATSDKNIKDWLRKYKNNQNPIGYLVRGSSDVQNNKIVHITLNPSKSILDASNANLITKDNLIVNAIFLTVRKIIPDTWINDRDQYLYPNNNWEIDKEFQSDCLTYALFENVIKSSDGKNHWIPYTEQEVDAKNTFESHFMTDFIKENGIEFSETAKEVLESGKELYKYYHSKDDSNPNASFYDIRMYFQGKNDKGTMNSNSTDEIYSMLLWNLRQNLKKLETKIIPKIYEYGFLIK